MIIHSIWTFIRDGGFVMVPLLALATTAFFMLVERFVRLWQIYKTRTIVSQIEWALSNGDETTARRIAHDTDGPIARVLASGLDHLDGDNDLLQSSLKKTFLVESAQLQKFSSSIQVIGAVLPMLGLLGTVHGMVTIFSSFSASTAGDPHLMATGISEALISTETALASAIPILFLHHQMTNWIDRILLEIKSGAAVLDHYVTKMRHSGTRPRD